MCGICGFQGFEDDSLLRRMSSTISHRGPDQKGTFIDRNVCLAHQRLSIIDLSEKGRQPMNNEDGSISIVYNGEIYNFKDIRAQLEKKHSFNSDSDTETLLHGYEEWGIKGLLKRLNGMFAFALLDSNRDEIILARDRLGIKPLYYTIIDGNFFFASEIKAILQYDGFEPKVNRRTLNEYLTFRHALGEETMFDGVKKLLPGHILKVHTALPPGKGSIKTEDRIKTEEYWNLQYSSSRTSPGNTAKQLLKCLEHSVRLRLLSDVPLGAFLSGGLDSSAIVALMSKASEDPVKTFSVGFGDSNFSELRYAKVIADTFNTDHHEINVELGDAVHTLPEIVWHLDEPLGDGSCIPTYLMSEVTKKHVTVILSGEGSDELYAGYLKYKLLKYGNILKRLPASPIPYRTIHLERLKKFIGARNNAERYCELIATFNNEEKEKLLPRDEYTAVIKKYPQTDSLFPKRTDYLNQLLFMDVKSWLRNDILLKSDKMSMAHAVEVRVPFLDHKHVEFSATVDPKLKLKGLKDKFIYRKAVTRILPKEIIKRKKQGFTLPIDLWMREGLKEIAFDTIDGSKGTSFFRKQQVKKIIDNHKRSLFYKRQLISLMMFNLWHNTFIENRGTIKAGKVTP
ncbi:asparagine synthase (glutamine-hydrolyzing) [Candidatus Woesearchaeota archaeon]|nr:asparagine synthase (glutamine-hydrolyzing) [Candidatus Woesearchaeota archaeon]